MKILSGKNGNTNGSYAPAKSIGTDRKTGQSGILDQPLCCVSVFNIFSHIRFAAEIHIRKDVMG